MKIARGIILFFLLVLVGNRLFAGEVDNYYAWGVEIEDSAKYFNEYLNEKIKILLEEYNSDHNYREGQCEDVAYYVIKMLGTSGLYWKTAALNTDMELWVQDNPKIDRYPRYEDSILAYERHSLYAPKFKFFGVYPVLLDAVVNIKGVYFGTEKISHFLGSGYLYYAKYKKVFSQTGSEELARQEAIFIGANAESGILGKLPVGVFSYADLEANYQGLLMAIDFCRKPYSYFSYSKDLAWYLAKEVDIKTYISPYWDESYNFSAYTSIRLADIKKNIKRLAYCKLLKTKWLESRNSYYESIDPMHFVDKDYRTYSYKLLSFLEGQTLRKIYFPFSEKFSLEAICNDIDFSEQK